MFITILLTLSSSIALGQTSPGKTCREEVDTLTNLAILKVADKMPAVKGGMEVLTGKILREVKYRAIARYPVCQKGINDPSRFEKNYPLVLWFQPSNHQHLNKGC